MCCWLFYDYKLCYVLAIVGFSFLPVLEKHSISNLQNNPVKVTCLILHFPKISVLQILVLYLIVLLLYLIVTCRLLYWCTAKVNSFFFFFFKHTPIIPTLSPTHSLECLSNIMMKHNFAPGVKDKPTGLCWASSVSCRLSRVMNISYGLVAKSLKFKN